MNHKGNSFLLYRSAALAAISARLFRSSSILSKGLILPPGDSTLAVDMADIVPSKSCNLKIKILPFNTDICRCSELWHNKSNCPDFTSTVNRCTNQILPFPGSPSLGPNSLWPWFSLTGSYLSQNPATILYFPFTLIINNNPLVQWFHTC